MYKYSLLVAIASVVAPPAFAQPTAAYYGLALGSFDYAEDASLGFPAIGDSVDSYRLMAGYQFSDHLAFEGGWGKTGTIRDSISFVSIPGAPTNLDFASEFEILTVRVLGVLNFKSGVTLLGGLGYASMQQDIALNITGFGSTSGESSGGEATLFAGVQYDWDRVALRLGFEEYDFSGGVDVSEASLTFFYKL